MQAVAQDGRRQIIERSHAAQADARRARRRAVDLRAASSLVLRQAERIVQGNSERRRSAILHRRPLFVVGGAIEDEPVEARWISGMGLICPAPLLERAQIVVAMGDTFSARPEGTTFVAALDNPYAALLTLMRAMTRIESVEMSAALPGRCRTLTIQLA